MTLQRNEGPFLLEWIAHHRAVGFTEILVYSNGCEDGSDTMLSLLADAGFLHHVVYSEVDGSSLQWQILKDAWRHPLRKKADWILVSDIDEFINIKTEPPTLEGLLKIFPEDTDAIVLPWRLFGSSALVEFIDAPVVEQFVRSAPERCEFPVAATFFKTLFRPEAFHGFGVHRPKPKTESDQVWCDGGGTRLPPVFAAAKHRLSLYGLPIETSLVEINHYSLKSAESFLVKTARGLPNRRAKGIDLSYWVERNFNTVRNDSIKAMSSQTKRELEKLRSLSGVPEAHRATVAWHMKMAKDVLATSEGHALFGGLLMAQDSAVLSPENAAKMVSLYQKVVASEG